MLYIIGYLLAILALGAGAWKLGQRSDLWVILLTPVLLYGVWRLFPLLEIHPGEGVAAGVAVVQFGLLSLIILGAFLPLFLAAGAWWQRRSVLMAGFVVLVLLPGAVLAVRRLVRGGPASRESAPPSVAAAPRNTYAEGYVWATDNGIVADSQCVNGAPAFLDGCRHAAGSHGAGPDRR